MATSSTCGALPFIAGAIPGRRRGVLARRMGRSILNSPTFVEYEVLTASDGEEALRLALDERPDLAVLDVNMPKLTGLEVVRAMRDRETTTHMPVIMLSANVQQANSARGLKVRADDYMKKPFSPQELVARV